MIDIKTIKTTDSTHYNFVEGLLVDAFPKEERRELDVQREFTDSNPLFKSNVILHFDKPVGLFTYWDFDDFYYIEHFAISQDARNGGFGKRVLEGMNEILEKPIVLEVEAPNDEMSKRRIGFYSRLGYELWEREYLQPPYRKGEGFLPMFLMVKGDLDINKDFPRIKDKIYKEVYLVEA